MQACHRIAAAHQMHGEAVAKTASKAADCKELAPTQQHSPQALRQREAANLHARTSLTSTPLNFSRAMTLLRQKIHYYVQ